MAKTAFQNLFYPPDQWFGQPERNSVTCCVKLHKNKLLTKQLFEKPVADPPDCIFLNVSTYQSKTSALFRFGHAEMSHTAGLNSASAHKQQHGGGRAGKTTSGSFVFS